MAVDWAMFGRWLRSGRPAKAPSGPLEPLDRLTWARETPQDLPEPPGGVEADDTVPVERLAYWLHDEFGGPYDWHRSEEVVRESYRRTARALMSQLPELFR